MSQGELGGASRSRLPPRNALIGQARKGNARLRKVTNYPAKLGVVLWYVPNKVLLLRS